MFGDRSASLLKHFVSLIFENENSLRRYENHFTESFIFIQVNWKIIPNADSRLRMIL